MNAYVIAELNRLRDECERLKRGAAAMYDDMIPSDFTFLDAMLDWLRRDQDYLSTWCDEYMERIV